MGNPALRVLFLPLYPETMPSSRLRVYQYLPYLERFGIDAAVLPALREPWFSKFFYSSSKGVHFIQYVTEALQNLGRIVRSRSYDVVFIQKGILYTNLRGFDRLLTRAHSRILFDLDDSVYGRNLVEFGWPLLRKLQDARQAEKISSRSNAVIAGNSYLKELALRYNRNVFVTPTPVETNRFLPRKTKPKREGDEVVIGWIGISSRVAYLGRLEKVFQELSRRYPIRFRLITRPRQEPFVWRGVRVDVIPWSYESEVKDLAEFDIGVMPLDDDEWSRGKCSLKLLQYMAMGIPSVSSRVGSNVEIIEEGSDGFLASETEEWVEKLSRLIEDRSLGEKMGQAARRKVVEEYSLEKMAPRLAEVLKGVGSPAEVSF